MRWHSLRDLTRWRLRGSRPMIEAMWQDVRQSAPARWIRDLVVGLHRNHVIESASAIAFDAFLSLIPVLAVAGYLLHRLHQAGGFVLSPLTTAAPPPIGAIAGAEFLRLAEDDVATLAPVSLVGFIWVSSAGLSTAMSVFERMFASRPRSWLARRAIAIACVLGGIATVAAAAGAAVLFDAWIGGVFAAVLATILPSAMMLGGLTAFHRIAIQRPEHVKRRALPGAVVTLALWAFASVAFSAYVTSLARYTTFYGSLAAVAILLFWLWLLSVALLVGGEVNAVLEGVRARSDVVDQRA